MTSLLLKMAQAAVNDETLFAAYIQQYATKKSISWNEVAYNLKIGQEQLAKLALCSRPQPALFTSGLLQVADYVGMDQFILKSFIAEVEGRKVVPVNKGVRPPKQVYKTRPSRSWSSMGILPKRISWAVGAVVLLVLIMGALALAQPKSAIAATLVVNEGKATIIQTAARSDSQLVVNSTDEAQAVRAGDRIMVPASATARLLFIDGSTVELTSGTELDVEELVIDDSNYRVHLRVYAGRTLSRVVTVLGAGDRFDVSTPSSTASVRGTVFTVAYISETETYISCDEGKVEVTLKDQTPQIVEAGMEVTAVVGQPLNVKSQQGIEIIESPVGTSPTTIESPAEVPQAAPDNNTESSPVEVELLPILNGPNGVGPVYNLPVTTGAVPDPITEEPPVGQPDPTPTVTPPPPSVNPEPPEPPPPPLVTICHQPGTPAEQTLEVAESAVQGHLDHGDTLGECPAPVNNPDGSGSNSGGNGGGDGSGINGGGNGNGNNGGGNGNGGGAGGGKTKTK